MVDEWGAILSHFYDSEELVLVSVPSFYQYNHRNEVLPPQEALKIRNKIFSSLNRLIVYNSLKINTDLSQVGSK